MKTIVAASAVALALCACGGGGGGSSSPVAAVPTEAPASSPTPASSPSTPPISVTFEGDSTMFGIGAGSGQSEPDDIHAILGMDFTNAGISGTWTAENLAGTAPFTTPLATRLAVDPSKIVVMNYGINDSHEVTLDEYEQNLFDWVRTVRSFGKIPVFEEPNPSSIASFQAVLPAYVAAMDRAAQQLNVPIVPQYYRMQQIPNWQALLSDGLHPNAQGYAVKAQETAAVLKTVIASIQ